MRHETHVFSDQTQNDWTGASSVDFRVTNTFEIVDRFLNLESVMPRIACADESSHTEASGSPSLPL